jgi:hypothetical protein
VIAPAVGLLWTPGYWGWGGGVYVWHAGYWGPHVGFYGGINYGFGYTGVGFYGGEWRGGVYHYNTSVTNVNTTVIHNTYNTTVINNHTTINNVSYNGGTGGTMARPNASEEAAARERHISATSMQTQHEQAARSNRAFLASENHGHPGVAATAKPGVFSGPGVVAAHSSNSMASHGMATRPGDAGNRSAQMDRPPSSRNNTSGAVANSKHGSEQSNRPQQSVADHSRPAYTMQNNSSHPNNAHPNNSYPNNSHPDNSRANDSHPSYSSHPNTSHPSEPHEHPGGGHPGGRMGR